MTSQYCPLSASPLWNDMVAYYDDKGIEAWQDKLPCFVTTNQGFCHHYAHLLVSFFLDGIQNKVIDSTKPVYIVEIGAGFGRFSYGILTKMLGLMKHYRIESLPFTYVITDISDKNLALLKKQEQFKPFIEKGQLDFAKFNAIEDTAITLFHQSVTLNPTHIQNPVFFIGNYLLDTLQQDLFYVDDDKKLSAVYTQYEKIPEWKLDTHKFGVQPFKLFSKVQPASHTAHPFYSDPAFNDILETHRTLLQDKQFLLPVGGLRLMQNVKALTGGKAIFCFADKGCATAHLVQHSLNVEPIFHAGCCSFDVNFFALGEYAKMHRGDIWYNPIQTTFGLYVLSLDVDLSQFDRASQLYAENLIGRIYHTLQCVDRNTDDFSIAEIIQMLETEHWDPTIFNGMLDRLIALWPRAMHYEKVYILNKLEEALLSYYEIPVLPNFYGDLGFFYTKTEQYAKAMPLLEKSLKLFKADTSKHALMKECCKQLKMVYTPKSEAAIKLYTHVDQSKAAYNPRAVFNICWRTALSTVLMLMIMYMARS